jgi:serine/threonine-protein kinase
MADIFAMQDEISAAIAEALKVKLAPMRERRIPSLPAYEAYLRYRSYQWKFTPEASQRSRECLEQALALDPGFALPYVGLADYHLALGVVGIMRAQQAMPRARELAQRALEIDSELPEAHAMLGLVAAFYDFDWREAERRFCLATAREPLTPHLRQWYSQWLFSIGRTEEALRQNARVIDEDPLCQMWHHMRAQVLQSLGLDDESLDASKKVVEIDPQFWLGWIQLGLRYAIRGRHNEALRCAEKGYAIAPWSAYGAGITAARACKCGADRESRPLSGSFTKRSIRGAYWTRRPLSGSRRRGSSRGMVGESGGSAVPRRRLAGVSHVRAAAPAVGRLAGAAEESQPRIALSRHRSSSTKPLGIWESEFGS